MDREGKRKAAAAGGLGSKRGPVRNWVASKALAAAGKSSGKKQQSSNGGTLCAAVAAASITSDDPPPHGPNGNVVASSSYSFCQISNNSNSNKINNNDKKQQQQWRRCQEESPVANASTAAADDDDNSNGSNYNNDLPRNVNRGEEDFSSLPSSSYPPPPSIRKQPSSSKLRLKMGKPLDEGIRVNPLTVPRKVRTAMVKKPQELLPISPVCTRMLDSILIPKVSSTQSGWSERELEVAQILCDLDLLMTLPASSPSPPPGSPPAHQGKCLAPKSKRCPITSTIEEDTSNDADADESQQQSEEHHPSEEDDQRLQPIKEPGLLLAPLPSHIVDEPPPSLVKDVTNPNPDTENWDMCEKKLMIAGEKKPESASMDACIAELEAGINGLPGFNPSYQNEDVNADPKIPVNHQTVCSTDIDMLADSEQPADTANLVNTDRSVEKEKHSGDVGKAQVIAVEYSRGAGEEKAGMEALRWDRADIHMFSVENKSMKRKKMEAELPKQLSLETVKGAQAKSKISKAERSGAAASPPQITTASTSALSANNVYSLDPSNSMGTVQWPAKMQPLGCHYSSAAITAVAAAAAWPEAIGIDGVHMEDIKPSSAHMEDIKPSSAHVHPLIFPAVVEKKTWKRCERHVYIAHFIELQQQLQRHPALAAAYKSVLARSNDSDPCTNFRNRKSASAFIPEPLSGSSKERSQGPRHKGASLYTDTMPKKGFAEHPTQGTFPSGEVDTASRETPASGAVCRSGSGMIAGPGNNSSTAGGFINAATASAAAAQLHYMQATIQHNTSHFPLLSPSEHFRLPAHISPHQKVTQFYGSQHYKSIQQTHPPAAASAQSQQTESQSRSQSHVESNMLGHSAAPYLTVGLGAAGQSAMVQSTGDMANFFAQMSQQQNLNGQALYAQQQQHLVDSQKPALTGAHQSRANLESSNSYFSDCNREQDLPFHANQSAAGSWQTVAGSQLSPSSMKFSRPAILGSSTLGPTAGPMSMGSVKLLSGSSVAKQKVSQQLQALPATGHGYGFFSTDSPASSLAQQGSEVVVKSVNRGKTKQKSSRSKKTIPSSSSSPVSRSAALDSTLTNSAVVMGANYTTQGRPSYHAQNLQSSQLSQESSPSTSTHQIYQQLPLHSSSTQSQPSLQMKQHNEFQQQQQQQQQRQQKQQQQQPLFLQSQQYVQQQSSHSLLNGHGGGLSAHHQQQALNPALLTNVDGFFSFSDRDSGAMRANGSASPAKSPGSPYVDASGSCQISFGGQTVRHSQSNNAMLTLQHQQGSAACQLTSGSHSVNHQQAKQLSGCKNSNAEESVPDCGMAGLTSKGMFSSTTSLSSADAHASMDGKGLYTPSAAVMHEGGGAKQISNNLLHHQAMVGSQ